MESTPVSQPKISRWLAVTAVIVTLVSLVPAAFCAFLVSLATYGLYSWTEPTLNSAAVLPLIGVGLTLPLGPLVMTLGPHRSRWLRVALFVSLGGVALVSLATWVPVAVGWR